MEIKNEKELKNIYKSIIQNKPGGNKNCLDFEYIKKSFTDELDEVEKFKIIDHITKCSSCLKIFNLLRDFSLEGEKITDRFNQDNLVVKEAKSTKEVSEKKTHELDKRPVLIKEGTQKEQIVNIWRNHYLKFFAMAAAIFIIIVGINFIVKPQIDHKDNIFRGQNVQEVRLISPKGKTNIPIIFKWGLVKNTLNYQVILLDKELTEIWISVKTNNNSNILPDNILKKMKKGDIYFWKVVLFLKNNKTSESDLQEFSVKKK